MDYERGVSQLVAPILALLLLWLVPAYGESSTEWEQRLRDLPTDAALELRRLQAGGESDWIVFEGRLQLITGAPRFTDSSEVSLEQYLYLVGDHKAYRITLQFLKEDSHAFGVESIPRDVERFAPIGVGFSVALGHVYRVRGVSMAVDRLFGSGGQYGELETRGLIVDAIEYVGAPPSSPGL